MSPICPKGQHHSKNKSQYRNFCFDSFLSIFFFFFLKTEPKGFFGISHDVAKDDFERVNELLSPLLPLKSCGELGSLGSVGHCGHGCGVGIGELGVLERPD